MSVCGGGQVGCGWAGGWGGLRGISFHLRNALWCEHVLSPVIDERKKWQRKTFGIHLSLKVTLPSSLLRYKTNTINVLHYTFFLPCQ